MTSGPDQNSQPFPSGDSGKAAPSHLLRAIAIPGAFLVVILNFIGHCLGWLSHLFDSLPIVQKAEIWVRSLSPHQSLYLLIGILCLLAPLEGAMVWALASCHFELFLILEITSKILTPLLLVRTWSAAQSRILEMPACRLIYEKLVVLYRWSLAILHGLPGYQSLSRFVAGVEHRFFTAIRYIAAIVRPTAIRIAAAFFDYAHYLLRWSGLMKFWPAPGTEGITPATDGMPRLKPRLFLYIFTSTLVLACVIAVGVAFFATQFFDARLAQFRETATARGIEFSYDQNHGCSWVIPCRVLTHVQIAHSIESTPTLKLSAGRVKLHWYWWEDQLNGSAEDLLLADAAIAGTRTTPGEWHAHKLHMQIHMIDSHASDSQSVLAHIDARMSQIDLTKGAIGIDAKLQISGPRFDAITAEGWDAWRRAGGIINIDRLALLDDENNARSGKPAELIMNGTLALDSGERPEGAFTLSGRDLARLAPELEPLIAPANEKTARNLQFVLNILAAARTQDNKSELRLPFSLQDGHAYIGPMKIFAVQPLFDAPTSPEP